MTAKKCTKKRDARVKLLFRQSKPIAFLTFSLPSSLLKLPNVSIGTLSNDDDGSENVSKNEFAFFQT